MELNFDDYLPLMFYPPVHPFGGHLQKNDPFALGGSRTNGVDICRYGPEAVRHMKKP